MKDLKQKYHFPDIIPELPQVYRRGEPQGWCSGDNKLMMNELSSELEPKIIIEIGSWLGMSTYNWLKRAPFSEIICIDPWDGGEQLKDREDTKDLYEKFIVNLWEFRDRIVPIKTTSLKGLKICQEARIKPDIIYVDGSHLYYDVICDLAVSIEYFPSAMICGDDWTWKTVREAVQYVANVYNINIKNSEKCWRLIR